MKFRVDRDIESVGGYQTFEVEAETLKDAYEKLQAGEGSIVDHEIDVTDISAFCLSDIYGYDY